MYEALATAQSCLRAAKRSDLSLADRLRAISLMADTVDRYFIAHAPHPTANAERAVLTPATPSHDATALFAPLLHDATQVLRLQLAPLLFQHHIRLPSVGQLGEQQQAWLFDYFQEHIYPLLTPLAVDPGHPFPYISSDSINLLILLQQPGKFSTRTLYARLKVPRQVVPRIIETPPLAAVDSPVLHHDEHERYWVWSEEVVQYFVHELFAGMSVTGIYQFRVLRAGGADKAEGVRDKTAPVVRIDIQHDMPPPVAQWLVSRLEAPWQAVIRGRTPLSMGNWADLARRLDALPVKI